ncbi:carboxypeptidase regulatory-like domain-containing protein [Persephonella sp.]
MFRLKRAVFLSLIGTFFAFLIASCGGGGGGNDGNLTEEDTVKIVGSTADSNLPNASVKITGSDGTVLGSTTSDETGSFELSASLSKEDIYCVTAEGTVEGTPVEMSSCFEYSKDIADNTIVLNINPLTDLTYEIYRQSGDFLQAETKVREYFRIPAGRWLGELNYTELESLSEGFKTLAEMKSKKLAVETLDIIIDEINNGTVEYKTLFGDVFKIKAEILESEVNNPVGLYIVGAENTDYIAKNFKVVWKGIDEELVNKTGISVNSNLPGDKSITAEIIINPDSENEKVLALDTVTVNFYKLGSQLKLSVADATQDTEANVSGNVSIKIPSGAVSEGATITFKEIIRNSTDTIQEFILEPAGMTFSTPIEIRVKYDPSVVSDPRTLSVLRKSEDGTVDALKIKEIDYVNHEVIFETEHFSRYKVFRRFVESFGYALQSSCETIEDALKDFLKESLNAKDKDGYDILTSIEKEWLEEKIENACDDKIDTMWAAYFALSRTEYNGEKLTNFDLLKEMYRLYRVSQIYNTSLKPFKEECQSSRYSNAIKGLKGLIEIYMWLYASKLESQAGVGRLFERLTGLKELFTSSKYEQLYALYGSDKERVKDFIENIVYKIISDSIENYLDRPPTKYFETLYFDLIDGINKIIASPDVIAERLNGAAISADFVNSTLTPEEVMFAILTDRLYMGDIRFVQDEYGNFKINGHYERKDINGNVVESGSIVGWANECDDVLVRVDDVYYLCVDEIDSGFFSDGLGNIIRSLYRNSFCEPYSDCEELNNALYPLYELIKSFSVWSQNNCSDNLDFFNFEDYGENALRTTAYVLKGFYQADRYAVDVSKRFDTYVKLLIKSMEKDEGILSRIFSLEAVEKLGDTYSEEDVKVIPKISSFEEFLEKISIRIPTSIFEEFEIRNVSIKSSYIRVEPVYSERDNLEPIFIAESSEESSFLLSENGIDTTTFVSEGDRLVKPLSEIFTTRPDVDLSNVLMHTKVCIEYIYNTEKIFCKDYIFIISDTDISVEDLSTGTLISSVKQAVTNEPISEATVKISPINVVRLTDSSGNYKFTGLPPGLYTIEVYKDGYLPVTGQVTIEEGETKVFEAFLILDDEQATGNGILSGYILDALNSYGIANATIEFREGQNITSGEPITTIVTDASGFYSVELPAGVYTGLVKAEGYKSTGFTFVVIANETNNKDVSLSPVLQEGEIRIVLTWGEFPSDLDSHLVKLVDDSVQYHVYYSNMSPTDEAFLDVDDTTSFGPETITIINPDSSAVYRYYVHDYTTYSGSDSMNLANSGATVKVYVGEDEYTFFVPNLPGTAWKVFEIVNGEIVPCIGDSCVFGVSGATDPLIGTLSVSSSFDKDIFNNLPDKR